MSQTQATLVKHVLQDLGALAAGATVDTDDSALVTERLVQIYSDLSARRIYTVTTVDAIPDIAYPALLRVVVELCAPAFGRPSNKDVIDAAEKELAELSRRDRTVTGLNRQVLELLEVWGAGTATIDTTAITDRVQAILDDLTARRVIVFANAAAITTAAMPHIARLVAAQLTPKPLFDVIAAAEAALLAIGRLSRASTGLTRRVLEKLQFWGVTTGIDATHISDRVQETLDDLAMRDVILIADVDSIASETMPHLATILATSFLPPSAANERAVKTAEIALNRISRNGETTAPTQFEYASLFQRQRRGYYNGR